MSRNDRDDDKRERMIFLQKKEERIRRMTPYERTKAQVYATGNKWAIENFHATHD